MKLTNGQVYEALKAGIIDVKTLKIDTNEMRKDAAEMIRLADLIDAMINLEELIDDKKGGKK